ncbi:hypothetical protein M426DRAFT_71919 [Hypoxylon sp. CI-4A]|nr:hypothetical protein M426DRAFT_71919 [Hypoxylon sp. CI-4A]
MAGTVPDFSFPNTPFFNIYNDAPVISDPPILPSGQCNFVDLSHGAAPKCGCRRFWSRAGTSRGTDQAAWCMCNHHACYHDDVRDGQPPAAAVTPNVDVINNGQENERPRASREPLTPVVPELPFKTPTPMEPNMDFYTLNDGASFQAHLAEQGNALRNEVAAPIPEPSLPDTLGWTNLIQSQPDEGGLLPPIPSQCLMSSQPSSTTSSARLRYLRPFSGKGLETLSGAKSKLREPIELDDEPPPQEDTTAVVSVDQSIDDGQTVANTPRSSRQADHITRHSPLSPSGFGQYGFRQLSDTVHGHEQRLDRLENPSVSAVGHDACDEKHEHSDLRITELESRVEEVEKMINDSSSQISSHHRGKVIAVNESINSVVSVSTEGSEGVASRAELYSELQVLKSQLSQLQCLQSFPSYSRPWEVEVVFLPFPLKSVWVETHDFASQRLSGGVNSVEPDQWTQLPSSTSAALDPLSPEFSDWVGPEQEEDWLLARACAPDRVIEQRLRSRGLVKNVTIRNPDARSVQQAISDAFGTLFRTFSRMQANVHHGSTQHDRVAKFLGLQSPWVPLRKIHRDSRLRFLSPAEMVTPVTWDVPFLRSSVVMKATNVQRLFITQPEAYLQDQDAYDNGWNWQRLRELSRVYANSQSSEEVPEADAMEDCWAWNDTLDEHPASARSSQSLSLRQAAQLTPSLGTRRSVSRTKSPAVLRERKASRPPHIRTSSLPPIAHTLVSPAPAKRRVTSYMPAYDRRPSPQVIRVPHIAGLVKRRSTRSPSLRPRNTPRWSTASPSPVQEIYVARATTPYYATPYSNAPFFEARHARSSNNVIIDDGGSGTEGEGEYMDEDQDDDDEDGEEFEDEDNNDSPMLDFTHPEDEQEQESWQNSQLPGPEDEPWPGIEDAENRDPDLTIHGDMNSGENIEIDIHVDDDAMSRRSSVPSEYPSTQRAWNGAEEEFRVFEDGEGEPQTGNGVRR